MRLAFLVLALLSIVACSLPDRPYTASGSVDAPPDAESPDTRVVPDAAPPDAAQINIVTDPPFHLEVEEGKSAAFKVSLSNPPPQPLILEISAVPTNVLSVAPPSLTFTAADYATPKVVTIQTFKDPDAANGGGFVAINAPGLPLGMMDVQILDPDVQAIVATPPTLTIDEGSTSMVQVSLRYQPTATTTVSVAVTGFSDQIDLPALTFTSTDYNTPQVVQIKALHDSNTVDETSTLQLSAPDIPVTSVVITNHDTGS